MAGRRGGLTFEALDELVERVSRFRRQDSPLQDLIDDMKLEVWQYLDAGALTAITIADPSLATSQWQERLDLLWWALCYRDYRSPLGEQKPLNILSQLAWVHKKLDRSARPGFWRRAYLICSVYIRMVLILCRQPLGRNNPRPVRAHGDNSHRETAGPLHFHIQPPRPYRQWATLNNYVSSAQVSARLSRQPWDREDQVIKAGDRWEYNPWDKDRRRVHVEYNNWLAQSTRPSDAGFIRFRHEQIVVYDPNVPDSEFWIQEASDAHGSVYVDEDATYTGRGRLIALNNLQTTGFAVWVDGMTQTLHTERIAGDDRRFLFCDDSKRPIFRGFVATGAVVSSAASLIDMALFIDAIDVDALYAWLHQDRHSHWLWIAVVTGHLNDLSFRDIWDMAAPGADHPQTLALFTSMYKELVHGQKMAPTFRHMQTDDTQDAHLVTLLEWGGEPPPDDTPPPGVRITDAHGPWVHKRRTILNNLIYFIVATPQDRLAFHGTGSNKPVLFKEQKDPAQ